MPDQSGGDQLDAGLQTLRILAAEDDVSNQLVLETILNSLGLVATIVENGAEAIAAWETQRFDLILMDIQMPVLDGLDATREIRRRELKQDLAATPIIALTANVMDHQIAECLKAGMDGHLPKPFEIDKLNLALSIARELSSDLDRPAFDLPRYQTPAPL